MYVEIKNNSKMTMTNAQMSFLQLIGNCIDYSTE